MSPPAEKLEDYHSLLYRQTAAKRKIIICVLLLRLRIYAISRSIDIVIVYRWGDDYVKAWDVGCECLPPAIITDVITANHDERILSYYYVIKHLWMQFTLCFWIHHRAQLTRLTRPLSWPGPHTRFLPSTGFQNPPLPITSRTKISLLSTIRYYGSVGIMSSLLYHNNNMQISIMTRRRVYEFVYLGVHTVRDKNAIISLLQVDGVERKDPA